ncbi:MAG: hypothetical protein ACKV0T_01125, partial [Planctomycetales bacterium]
PERNAYTLYRQAKDALRPPKDPLWRQWFLGRGAVNELDEASLEYLESNREALELFREGSERPDAWWPGLNEQPPIASPMDYQDWYCFTTLAAVEALRLEQGDSPAQAWPWYRCMLQASRHCFRHSSLSELGIGAVIHGHAVTGITRWSNETAVDSATLRMALEETATIYEGGSPLSEILRAEFLAQWETLSDPVGVWIRTRNLSTGWTQTAIMGGVERRILQFLFYAWGEPEVGRRTLEHLWGNLLSQCDLPPELRVVSSATNKEILYETPADPQTGRLAPAEIERLLFASPLAGRMPRPQQLLQVRDQEEMTQQSLRLHLATVLFRRERGREPKSSEELRDGYLEASGERPSKPESPRNVRKDSLEDFDKEEDRIREQPPKASP